MISKIYNATYTKPLAVLLSASILCLSFGMKREMKEVTLKSGTPVNLETITMLNSETLQVGQMVDFRVVRDISADDVVVIPAGSTARGQVMRAERPKGLGKPGYLEVQIKSVTAIDGTEVMLSGGNVFQEGEDKQTLAILLGVFVCILFLTMKGKSAIVPAGYQVSGFTAGNTVINV